MEKLALIIGRISLVVLQLMILKTADAQINQQIWTEYKINLPLKVWSFELTTSYRTVVEESPWKSFTIFATSDYARSKVIDLTGGVFLSKTYESQSVTTAEVREMLGTRIRITRNTRILTNLLIRFEQRNQFQEETDSWQHSTRTRLLAEMTTPINKKSMHTGNNLWYGLLNLESFFVMDNDVKERFANRLRLQAGIGYRLSERFPFEFIYAIQKSKNTVGDGFYGTGNIYRFRVKQYINKN